MEFATLLVCRDNGVNQNLWVFWVIGKFIEKRQLVEKMISELQKFSMSESCAVIAMLLSRYETPNSPELSNLSSLKLWLFNYVIVSANVR